MDIIPIKDIEFLDNNIVKLKIGDGSYKSIHEVCVKEDCNYILKITKSDSLESSFQKAISKLDLTLDVIQDWKLDENLCILMKRGDKTIKMLLEEYKTLEVRIMILVACFGIIYKLHKNGYSHGDLCVDNIVVISTTQSSNKKGLGGYITRKYKYYFIDFKKSKNFPDKKDIKFDYDSFSNSIIELSRIDDTIVPLSRIAKEYTENAF